MKKVMIFIAITFTMATNAQVTKVSLQASGLTCSMCSNSINKSLKTIDYVLEVNSNLATYTFEILFKPGSDIDFDMIRKKVEQAGFSVSAFIATIVFENVHVKGKLPVIIGGRTFQFVNIEDQLLNGSREVKILDKGFVTPKEFKRNFYPISPPGFYYVRI